MQDQSTAGSQIQKAEQIFRHECPECQFVADIQTLFTFLIPREVREMATEEPKDCGVFTMTGWVGHSHFYLFRCRECGGVTVDYPHGYHGPYWYLRCKCCQSCLDLNSRKFRSIYADNRGATPQFLEEVEGWFRKRIKGLKTRILS